MSSEQTSLKDIFDFPQTGKSIQVLKSSHSKFNARQKQSKKENFFSIVRKAKIVALFTQMMKQKIAENQSLSNNTLKQNELYFLQNQSEDQTLQTYFTHDNKIIFGFDIFFGIIILIYCWNCTYQIIFRQTSFQRYITFITLLIYIIHILLFNMTEFKDKKQDLISDRKQITKYYIKKKALKDSIFLISLLITLIQFNESMHGLFVIFRVISLVCYTQFNEIYRKIENQIQVSVQTESVISMVKLIYKIVIFLHFLSLLLNFIAIVQNKAGENNTWLTSEKNNLQYDGNFQKYIIGWYWSATILSTVGFGQIVPANNVERFIISIIQILCCMSFGYFVNMIGSLIKLRNQPQEKYQKQLRSLNRCLNNMNPTNQLKHKIRNHYFNMHVIQSIHNSKQQSEVFENLSTPIKNGLIQENNIGFLEKCQVINTFSRQVLMNLTHKLKKIILAPQTMLYSGNKKQFKLWFIKNGTVQEYTDGFSDSKLKKVISIYNEKDPVVGFVNFFTQNIYKTMAKTKEFALLYELDQFHFLQIINQNLKQLYKFLTIKQIFLQKNKKYTSKCLSCDRYTHNAINCPRIHYVRKSAKKLAYKSKNLADFLLEQIKNKKKYNRSLLKFNWKVHFANGELQQQYQNQSSYNQSLHNTQNGQGMENLFKMISKQAKLQKKNTTVSKTSFCLSKKLSSYKNVDMKEILMNYESCRQVIKDDNSQFEEPFDRILQNQYSKQYMPAHDIEEVLLTYNKKSQKKVMKEGKFKHFKHTFQKVCQI